MAVVLSEVNID